MKVFVAGATGAIGRRLVPQLLDAGHRVVGLTRRPEAAKALAALGAEPMIADVYDAAALRERLAEAAPDVVMHQLTDLADLDYAANARLRIEGTSNLVSAATDAGVEHIVAQSIAWLYRHGHTPAVETDKLDSRASAYPGVAALEQGAAKLPHSVVLRYGALYGPGTWYAPDGAHSSSARRGEWSPGGAWTSFVHVDDAAAAAVAALGWPSGVYNIVDDEPAAPGDWAPVFCEALGAPVPPLPPGDEVSGRPVSNAAARALGWRPSRASWREGLPRSLAAS
ncbi:NAD-dependent epimerase/dehydratase family protein [Actinomadura mexicana]|uniref:Nucleoside-diphosphate-sugar epimerase n=1 Tax=Actinomadura mexicana TaxID=134959 RepID=A0A238UMM0_9ACTN|nr:NAD(P)-dependent oxidoreductase [Actinomadura mexicana]SNR22897.1 Nucleoside-diphosphate-sugar epimerase [Actinomadura mexicana]